LWRKFNDKKFYSSNSQLNFVMNKLL